MAQVDFSSAKLEPYNKSFWSRAYLHLQVAYLFDSGGTTISNVQLSTLLRTYNKVTLLFVGTLNASGTEFIIGNGTAKCWKVTNISFNAGDTYSFAIDIEIKGNT